MSNFAEKIMKWREDVDSPWSHNEAVANAVKKGKITAEEYEQITGEPYNG